MIALLAVLAIMVILLASVGLVIVNALKASPWGTFTLAMTIPIALLMGFYMRYWRPGRILEATAIGVALVLFAVVAGQWVNASPGWARVFTLSAPALALAIILYGYAASALPVWLLLAPRDYLSAFIKVGAVWALAAGILPAVILVVGRHLHPRRGAVARPEQLLLSIIRQVLLHQELSEPSALPTATANGTRLEAAGILLLR